MIENRFSFLGSMPRWMFGLFTLPIFIGIAMLVMDFDLPKFYPLGCILLPLIALTDREREIDAENGVIINRWKLYRLLQLWKKQERISNYEAITCRRAGGKQASTSEEEWVALVRSSSAKFSYVTFFDARKNQFCPDSRASAERLAKVTGLPIRDYPNRLFTRQAPSNNDESRS